MVTNIKLTIVSPVYRGEKMVSELVRRIVENVEIITPDYEIILVNDASPDNSWSEIEKECYRNTKVKGINLSRNFGQHYAITAGLNYAKGEWVVVMDCDLQDRPEEIPNLYKKTQEGWDIVYARRTERKDSFLKRLSSQIFHSIYSWLSGMKTDKSIANFGIYHSKVIKAFNTMNEVARAFGSLLSYVGFKTTAIEVKHSDRFEGKSSYSIYKLLKLSFDVIISNSNKPLRMAVALGFVMASLSFVIAIYNIIAHQIGFIKLEGFTTTVFSIWFVGGLMLTVSGILGLYIGKIFDQVKGRPIYIVRDEININ
jgi:dolichol-phosphate mannosyltransferase